jgi:hypothetical protein
MSSRKPHSPHAMEQPYPNVEFDGEVDAEGRLLLPRHVLERLPGDRRVTVRVTLGEVSKRLRSRGVTEEEIEEITMQQHEQRDRVVVFLDTEGVLQADTDFAGRADTMFHAGA